MTIGKFFFTNRFIEISAYLFYKKKMLLPLTNFTGISVACMVFELANILISLSASFIVIVLVNSEVIAIMLGCSLFLTIAFKVGWSVF